MRSTILNKIRLVLGFGAVLFAFLLDVAAQEKPPIIIKPTAAEEIRLAIADFQPKNRDSATAELNAVLQEFNSVLWEDALFCGWFAVENKSLYPPTPIVEPDHIKFSEWKTSPLSVDFLAMGNVREEGINYIFEVRLYDVKTQAQVFGQRYTVTKEKIRHVAHRFADEIVFHLTAGASKGIASTQIAFVSKRTGSKEIFVMDYDGQNQHALTNEKDIAVTPSWAPDNSKIAYTSWRSRFPEISIRSVVGNIRLSFPSFRSMACCSDFSPDGNSIAFSLRSPETDQPNIYVASVDGSRKVNITNSKSQDTAPSWSPTGRQIAFISDRSGPPQLYLIDADGANLRRLVNEPGSMDSPDWSPDGRYIVFTWRPREQPSYDLYIYDMATSKIFQITSNSGTNESPNWSPDGRHIVFESNRDGNHQIYVMLSDGTRVKRLTSGSNNEAPAWSNYPR